MSRSDVYGYDLGRSPDPHLRPRVYNARDVGLGPNTSPIFVYVGRPTKWGNPYLIGQHGTRSEVIALYRRRLENSPKLLADLHELRGKDLICWCAPQACHADVLLELANSAPSATGGQQK